MIVMQISALQMCYYATLCFCCIIVDTFWGLKPHPAQVFSSLMFNDLSLKYGYPTIFAKWLNLPFVVLQ